ncbi:winged helix-turn-helix transcriptional regulator [Archangium minus]|uniref:Winged helix-turn-helix transcriptional regulator n=1 Tax=Archangium minus TaxID=83450 RepID=A0ABY9WHT7_9BACT|nr:winged helix-turn-helix transcriptional regulator [Archangium minus]
MTRSSRSPFEALADPNRRAILRLLRQGSLTAGEIAVAFELTRPTLSHHFKVLEGAGLVRSEKRGTHVVYTLQTNVLEDLASELMELTATVKASTQKKGKA